MNGARTAGVAAVVVALAAVASPAARAADTTRCAFGGPTGTSRVLELAVDHEAAVNLVLTGVRTTRPAADSTSWHLAQGVFVIDPGTLETVASRITNSGASNRRAVVDVDGQHNTADVPGPDLPFSRTALDRPPALDPGTYLIAAFGSDGDRSAPNDGWGGYVEVAGAATCRVVGSGSLTDLDQSDLTGTQVSAPGLAHIDGASYRTTASDDLVVGFLDAATQGAGSARVDYEHPWGSGTVEQDIRPFTSSGGSFSWTAHATGPATVVSVLAMGFDLP